MRGQRISCYFRFDAEGFSVAGLGRAAGYTLRQPALGINACVTEPVFDALFGILP